MSSEVNETCELLKKMFLENKMARVITVPTDGMRRTSLENKMARCDRY
jgi:hypothetical protein